MPLPAPRFIELGQPIRSLDFLPDEDRLVVLGDDLSLASCRVTASGQVRETRRHALTREIVWPRGRVTAGSLLARSARSVLVVAVTGSVPATAVLHVVDWNLRTGKPAGHLRFPCPGPWGKLPLLAITEQLLLVGFEQDAILLDLSSGQRLGTLRESLWETPAWEADAPAAPWSDDVLCPQGLVWDGVHGLLHALLQTGESSVFWEAYALDESRRTFRLQRRRGLRNGRALGIAGSAPGKVVALLTAPARSARRGQGPGRPQRRTGHRPSVSLAQLASTGKPPVMIPLRVTSSAAAPDPPRRGPGDSGAALCSDDNAGEAVFLAGAGRGRVAWSSSSGWLWETSLRTGSTRVLAQMSGAVTACRTSPARGLLAFGDRRGQLAVLRYGRLGQPERHRRTAAKPVPVRATRGPSSAAKPSPPQRRAERRIRQMGDERSRRVHLTEMELEVLPELLREHPHWEHLGLGSTRLSTLPEWLGEFQQLQELTADFNQLTSLPDSLCSLRRLEKLNLTGNQLRELPVNIGQLVRLRDLQLARNPLAALPRSFQQLKELRRLDLCDCPLQAFPPVLRSLTKLESLALAGTGIAAIPEWIGELRHLEELDLSGNPLRRLPDGMRQLRHLQAVDLSRTDLRALPDWLTQWQTLEELNLCHCPNLRAVPAEIWSLGDVSTWGSPVDTSRNAADD
ncbi:MAG: leucine-rich repeat domain-containing protein [Pirellulales bacterium]